MKTAYISILDPFFFGTEPVYYVSSMSQTQYDKSVENGGDPDPGDLYYKEGAWVSLHPEQFPSKEQAIAAVTAAFPGIECVDDFETIPPVQRLTAYVAQRKDTKRWFVTSIPYATYKKDYYSKGEWFVKDQYLAEEGWALISPIWFESKEEAIVHVNVKYPEYEVVEDTSFPG